MNNLTNPIFNDADAARLHLENLRWPEGPVCPHCNSSGKLVAAVEGKKKTHRKGLYFCNSCQGQFTVTVGTVMEQSHVPLNKWLLAFYLMCASKKGYSAHQLHRTIEVSYKTAWFMAHRIREAMRTGGLLPPMGGEGSPVEVDETFIGKKAEYKTFKKPRGSFTKQAVLTLVNRKGEARSFHIDRTSASEIVPIVEANISKEATVMTDDANYYNALPRHGFKREKVNHSSGEYGRGVVHTNTVESYFSVFKRGMKGTYQHCSEKHLHRYLAEFDFRYNNRTALGVNDAERAVNAIRQIGGKRLTYRRTDQA